jgi:hypothetical protein
VIKMGKGDNRDKKDTKKAPKKTLMEKRAEKREKKQGHHVTITGQPQGN